MKLSDFRIGKVVAVGWPRSQRASSVAVRTGRSLSDALAAIPRVSAFDGLPLSSLVTVVAVSLEDFWREEGAVVADVTYRVYEGFERRTLVVGAPHEGVVDPGYGVGERQVFHAAGGVIGGAG